MPKKATPAPVTGFQIRPRYREVVCDWFELEDGEEPFTATIRTNLTFDQINAIPAGDGVTFSEVWEQIAEYVTKWNLVAEDETGAMVAVPPPAEAGPDVFRAMDAALNVWLIAQVRTAHLGGPDRKNGSTPSGATPAPGGGKS